MQAPAQNTTTVMAAPAPTGHVAYVTQSNHGTWLFAPHDGGRRQRLIRRQTAGQEAGALPASFA